MAYNFEESAVAAAVAICCSMWATVCHGSHGSQSALLMGRMLLKWICLHNRRSSGQNRCSIRRVSLNMSQPPASASGASEDASIGGESSTIDLRQNDTHAEKVRSTPQDPTDIAPRSFLQVLCESDKFTAFKAGLMVTSNDWWTFTVLVGITVWSLLATTSRDTSTNALGVALNTSSTVARAVAFTLTWIVALSAASLEHVSQAAVGRWATIRALAAAVVQSAAFTYALSFITIGMSLNHGLKLLWFTTLESCTVAPTSLSPGSCTPSTFSLPSDRISIIFLVPIVAHIYLPSMRLNASILSWLVGCICIAASYVRIGVFVDTFNLLTAAFVPFVLFKFDAAVWSSFTLHEQTVRDAEHALASVERTNALERTLMETEKTNVETRSAELRSMMGNVAHDLKTPIQSIAMGVELLRYILHCRVLFRAMACFHFTAFQSFLNLPRSDPTIQAYQPPTRRVDQTHPTPSPPPSC